jgi:probable HAF family extracellular repeat protein
MKPSQLASRAFLFSAILIIANSPLLAGTFHEINYPNSNSTSANSINDSNEIVGYYQDVNNIYHAYAYNYSKDSYTTIDPPGSTFALAASISNSGVIVGGYSTTGKEMGFIDEDGKYTDVIYPDSSEQGTALWGVNDNGMMVGNYWITNSKNETQTFGFVLDHGKFTKLEYPGATTTLPNSVNDSGEIVGTYTESNGETYGFTYLNGKFTSFSYPGEAGVSTGAAINDKGVLIGGYYKNPYTYGFVSSGGKYTTIDYPGKNGVPTDTSPDGINSNSYIVGFVGSGYSPQGIGFLYIP